MASQKNDTIVKHALQFWLDGASLDKALAAGQAKFKADNALSKKNSEISSKKQMDAFVNLTKLTNNKIERINQSSRVKEEAAGKKANLQKIVDDKKTTQKRWDERKRIRKRGLADEVAAEKAADAKKKKNSISGGFENFGGKLGTISSYGAAIAIINAVRQSITFVITKTIEFEKAFTDLAVKSGFTKKEMSKVTDSIYDVANATKFSTLEIVGAATNLGKLGFEANEVGKILPHLATVAGATSESLEETSKVFGKVINAYQLSADNAQNIADRMVQIFNSSALDLEKFNTAFSYVGSAAASTGTSVDELTAAMAILSDRGVTASKIGTGLRNVFTKLGREGDTLRDIIKRVNDEQLSFYEIAEIVGRRAANQLFILTDSMDEFDGSVAESSKKYGQAMEANAIQMDTFSAKWDIFMNNITNKVTGADADPLSDWRYNFKKSIDLMDIFSSFNIFNSKGSEATTSNFLNANQQIFAEVRKLKAENADMTEDEMKRILLEPYQRLNALVAAGKMTLEEAQAAGIERQEIVKMFANSDGDDVFKAIQVYLEGEQLANVKSAQAAYKSNIQSLSTFISANTTSDVADDIRKAILANENAVARLLFDDAFKESLGSERYATFKARLEKVLNNRGSLTVGAINSYKNSQSGVTARESLKKELDEIDGRILRVSTGLGKNKDGLYEGSKTDIKNLDNANKERKAFISKWCALSKDQPFLTDWLVGWGIICEEPKAVRKKKGVIGEFELNEKAKSDYETKKDRLTKEYNLLDDPIKKASKNQELIELEFTYRERLNEAYAVYLREQGRLRDEFAKKYPDDIDRFDENVKSNEKAQIRSNTAGVKQINTLELRDLSDTAEAYKQDFNLRQAYLESISALDLKYKDPETDTPQKRRLILEERNNITEAYYKVAEGNLSTHYEKMAKELERLEKKNEKIVKDGGTPINLEGITTLIGQGAGMRNKLKTERNKAIKPSEEPDDDDADFDYFGEAMTIYDNVSDIFNQLGQAKLEMLKEQVQAELDVIQGRYDDEKSIVDSALNSGIISQENAFAAEEKLKKKKIQAENAAEKKLFDAQKKQDTQEAVLSGIAQTAQAVARAFAEFPTPVAAVMAAVSAAAIAGASATNIATIGKRKYIPKKYATGGLVEGDSHAQGGVPFSVNGYGGYEMEGGEFIVNKEATKKHMSELERINGKTTSGKRKWADGGYVDPDVIGNDFNVAIIEALSKPVRAYVTDQDLAKSESERNALSKKTTY